MGDWYLQATYLNSKQEEANYKILDTGTPLVGDMPTKPTLTAPDGRPIYNQSESQFKPLSLVYITWVVPKEKLYHSHYLNYLMMVIHPHFRIHASEY